MARQDDRSRDEAINAVDALYDSIKDLELKLSTLQDRYDELEKKCEGLEEEIVDLKAREE